VYFLSFILLTAFSSVAYSHYHATKILNQKNICCKKTNNSGETIFESMVKQFVGAVKMGG
jgi:hypothetical protein